MAPEGQKPQTYTEQLAQRRTDVKQSANKSLAKVINKDESFNFRLYTYTPQEISKAQLFEEESKERSLTPREAILVKA